MNAEVQDIIAGASDADLLMGLARRGIESSMKLADGRVRVLIKLNPAPKHKSRPTKPRKVSAHPDAFL